MVIKTATEQIVEQRTGRPIQEVLAKLVWQHGGKPHALPNIATSLQVSVPTTLSWLRKYGLDWHEGGVDDTD